MNFSDLLMYFLGSVWQSSLKQLSKEDSFIIPIKGRLKRYVNVLAQYGIDIFLVPS